MEISDIAKQLGKRGGEATKKSKDPDYYKKIGALGGKKKKGYKKPL